MAGETTLAELAALLSLSRVAVANDSGGMHLAAAVGTKVVALYGATDPAITGPLGDGHIILMSPGVQRGRDIDRKSKIGKSALEAISVDSVCEAILRVL
jgi:ADP-heptose:LPS heptosyltransferase